MSRLLIVEDDESQLRSLTAVMEEEGFEVIGCSSASEALGHLRLLDAGVAVVDLRLGDLSEKELLAKLSAYAGRVNFIINTAYSSFESAKDALNLGAFAYVEKAGDPDELVRHVHRAFQASLHSYADELEAAVAERTRELLEVNEALKKDITDRKRAEEAVRRERDRAQEYLDVAGVMFVVIDADRKVRLINKKGCEILGYDEDEVIGKDWFKNFLPESVREDIGAIFDTLVAGDIEPLEYHENPIINKDGSERLIAWHNTLLRDENGKIIGTLSSGEDITEHREAEEQLREHQAELAHVWRVNTMGEMASGLAHELNQPLCAILNYANACLRMTKRGTDEPDKVTEALEQITAQTDRAGQIIRRIRSLVAKRKPRQSTVDVNGVVREVVEMQKAEASQKGITVRTELAEDLPLILADGVEIEAVVLNLVRNAFDAMSDPALERREATIRTSVSENNSVEATVTDSGKGLLGEDPENIFDLFFTTKADGLGIGLSISRTIIEGHGGRLWAEPNPDCGVSFRFTLPVAGLWSGRAVRG